MVVAHFAQRSRLMALNRIAAALFWVLTLNTAAQACDSYADDMALASVLARAVAEARAQGALPRAATTAAVSLAVGEREPGPAGPANTGPAEGKSSLSEVSFLP